jgi:hypothetical protein
MELSCSLPIVKLRFETLKDVTSHYFRCLTPCCRIVYALCINRLSCNGIVVDVIAVCTVKLLFGLVAVRPNNENWREKTGNAKGLILRSTLRCGGMVVWRIKWNGSFQTFAVL